MRLNRRNGPDRLGAGSRVTRWGMYAGGSGAVIWAGDIGGSDLYRTGAVADALSAAVRGGALSARLPAVRGYRVLRHDLFYDRLNVEFHSQCAG